MLPAVLLLEVCTPVFSARRVDRSSSGTVPCQRSCKRMSALATWRRNQGGVHPLLVLPMLRRFRAGNRADKPRPTLLRFL